MDRVTGGKGGTLTGLRKHFACERIRGIEGPRGECALEDLSALVWHLRGMNLVLATGYCRPSIGYAGSNVGRMKAWAAFLRSLADPWAIYCDWNMTPQQLMQSGWLQLLADAEPQILVP